jgi:hypothetical protein
LTEHVDKKIESGVVAVVVKCVWVWKNSNIKKFGEVVIGYP